MLCRAFMTRICAITGGSGAGKTTIARALSKRLGESARVIGEDDYYRCSSSIPNFDPDTYNFDEPAAKDDGLLLANLESARRGEAFDKPLYDLKTHRRRREVERVEPTEIVIVEGIHLLAFADLSALYDLAVFVEADESLRLGRRMIRDVETRKRTPESILHQFFANVRPMHEAYVVPQRARAGLVLVSTPFGGAGEAAAHAEIIAQRLGGAD
jgi:uridine kinase